MVKEKKQKYLDEKIQDHKYSYEGPVLCYGKVISNKFKAQTYATTKARAVVNIKDQYKRWNGFGKRFDIKLNDDLVMQVD